MPSRVRVVVPASTANLGPGFDCLGLALGLYNTFELTVRGRAAGVEVVISGEGSQELRRDEGNLIARAALDVWQTLGKTPGGLAIRAENGIPLGSGLGSSAAAAVGGLAAANALLGGPLSREAILRRAYEMEGHPDNAAAALFGGLTLVSATDSELRVAGLDIPPLETVIALPDVQLSTAAAREALPASVPLADAVFNVGRTAFVVRALQTGDYDLLEWAMQDRLHQPYRRHLIPAFAAVDWAARSHGAVAVCLSGAGPSLAAFAPDRHAEIAAAMKAAFVSQGVACRTYVLPVDRQGVRISVLG